MSTPLDGFVMYNDNVTIRKQEVFAPIPDYMVPVDFCQKE